jgi:hypothetical protein
MRAVLKIVGRRHRVFQNHEAFNFMHSLVGDKLTMYETAGSLHGDKRVWMMVSIPKVILAVELALSSHRSYPITAVEEVSITAAS